MKRILQFLWRSLIRAQHALRIGLQINRDLAITGDVSGLLVVFEILTVNLIEARRTPPINRDRHIVEFRPSALFKLDCLASLQFKQRSALVRFRNREPVCALLDFNPDLPWNLLQRIRYPVLRIKIGSEHRDAHEYRRARKPSAQAGDGYGH